MLKINFIKQFLLSPKKTGAIASSSEELAELITNKCNLSDAKVVVELGSGTGVFTEKIIKKINSKTIFFVLEINSFFIKKTKKRCLGVKIYKDSAINIDKYLKLNKVDICDCIISGLPWASFDKKLQETLIDKIVSVLKPGAEFVTFAYLSGIILPSAKRFRNILNKKFRNVNKTRTVWKNLPPAFVYYCKK